MVPLEEGQDKVAAAAAADEVTDVVLDVEIVMTVDEPDDGDLEDDDPEDDELEDNDREDGDNDVEVETVLLRTEDVTGLLELLDVLTVLPEDGLELVEDLTELVEDLTELVDGLIELVDGLIELLEGLAELEEDLTVLDVD